MMFRVETPFDRRVRLFFVEEFLPYSWALTSLHSPEVEPQPIIA